MKKKKKKIGYIAYIRHEPIKFKSFPQPPMKLDFHTSYNQGHCDLDFSKVILSKEGELSGVGHGHFANGQGRAIHVHILTGFHFEAIFCCDRLVFALPLDLWGVKWFDYDKQQ